MQELGYNIHCISQNRKKDAINQYFYESGKENTVLYDNDAKQMFDDLVNKFDVINKLLNKGN